MISRLKIYIAIISFLSLTLAGCSDQEVSGIALNNDMQVKFLASVADVHNIKTRVPVEDSLKYVTWSEYNCDFYLQSETYETIDGIETPVIEYGTYVVPSTYEGRLDVKKTDTDPNPQMLNWKSLRGQHTFTGWTFPSGDKPGYGSNPFADMESDDFQSALKEGVPIKFMDSEEGDNYDNYHNNNVYETFIGSKEGPVNYVDNGTYVSMNFRHLVSKIYIDELILNWNGSIQEHLKANMTIYGIPTNAIFYPDPDQAGLADDENYNDGWPVVVPVSQEDDEMTFYIDNDADHQDYVWVCPEIDFRNLSFSISLLSTENEFDKMKDYYGTFENVVFERDGTNWDWGNGEDDTILHAGEMMSLKIILYPGGGGGVIIRILPWSTHEQEGVAHYSHPGIYSDKTLNDIVQGAGNQDTMQELFDLYGQTEDGKKMFYLYENVNLTENNLMIPDDYTIDGNGHLITVSKSPLNIKNVVNVYITDGNGNYVYIDSEGNVYKVDANTFTYTEDDLIGTLPANTKKSLNFSPPSLS